MKPRIPPGWGDEDDRAGRALMLAVYGIGGLMAVAQLVMVLAMLAERWWHGTM